MAPIVFSPLQNISASYFIECMYEWIGHIKETNIYDNYYIEIKICRNLQSFCINFNLFLYFNYYCIFKLVFRINNLNVLYK